MLESFSFTKGIKSEKFCWQSPTGVRELINACRCNCSLSVYSSYHGRSMIRLTLSNQLSVCKRKARARDLVFSHPQPCSRRRPDINDPRSGSPNRTLLRLLPGSSHCDKYGFHHHRACAPQQRSPHFSKQLSPGQRRAVCTKGRDVINVS